MLAFDNVGVGGTTGRTPDTVEQMARDALDLVDALGIDDVDVLGFSLGSFVAQELALSDPISCAASCSPRPHPEARPACTAGPLP